MLQLSYYFQRNQLITENKHEKGMRKVFKRPLPAFHHGDRAMSDLPQEVFEGRGNQGEQEGEDEHAT